MLVGDEHFHYWVGENGLKYVFNQSDNAYQLADTVAMRSNLDAMLAKRFKADMARKSIRKRASIPQFVGKKKGLVILAQFPDKPFAAGHDATLFNKITNQLGYNSQDGFIGSVKDYFMAQSSGQFEMDFDVVGPVTMSHPYAYYGNNDHYGNDQHPGEMVAEACMAVNSGVDFKDYDWNGDGEVDMVYVLYAGQGEADGGALSTIWPHEWDLADSDYGTPLLADGITVNTYACSNELNYQDKIAGIGTMCHEFSHCLGLPDMYDVDYGGNYGMGSWDLMDNGNYNGNGFCPAGYTSYEKMFCGWSRPTQLSNAAQSVVGMKPLSEGGDSYIIYNGGDNDEYYLLENRQRVGWDAGLPSSGMLILHVDYDADVWNYNVVNSTIGGSTTSGGNDHQRCTIFHADNDDDHAYWEGSNIYSKSTDDTDVYPYLKNDSLTDNSVPMALTYNANIDGSMLMNKGISKITQNTDGTMSFNFSPTSSKGITVPPKPVGDVLFYESFDNCRGTGGNDDTWGGSVALSPFKPDNDGWYAPSGAMYGGDECARFGKSGANGNVITPEIIIDGAATLSFKVAPWGAGSGSGSQSLDVYVNDTYVGLYGLPLGQWTEITIPITGGGSSTIWFVPGDRFFLDEVKVVANGTQACIKVVGVDTPSDTNNCIYSVDGHYLGTDINVLPKGVYIVSGKKVMR